MLNQDEAGDPMPDLQEMLAMRQKDTLYFWGYLYLAQAVLLQGSNTPDYG